MSRGAPLFIFSLPRAGSTLVQRLLSQHPQIATTSEPWLLLPLLTMTEPTAGLACYSHGLAAQGIGEFIDALPNGRAAFRERLGEFVTDLYAQQCPGGELYFLDKTPRYYLIIDDIAELFPSAKFIFLFRHPLQVIASILDTWAKGTLRRVYEYRVDISHGIPLLAQAAEKYQDRSVLIHYDALVAEPHENLARLFEFLSLPADLSVIDRIAQTQLPGRFGDQTGARQYQSITSASRDKWRVTLASPYRVWLFRRWLSAIPLELRSRHTLNHGDPVDDLTGLPPSRGSWGRLGNDVYDHLRGYRRHVLRQTRLRCFARRTWPQPASTLSPDVQ